MSAQAIAVVVGLGAVGVAEYRSQHARPGGDWLFGAIMTAGLLLSFVIAVQHA